MRPNNMDLLWTNPNSTVGFAPQTISLDLSAYTFVAVSFKSATSNDAGSLIFSAISSSSVSAEQSVSLCITQTLDLMRSRAFRAGIDGIKFQNGQETRNFGQISTNNSVCIPYQIFGI